MTISRPASRGFTIFEMVLVMSIASVVFIVLAKLTGNILPYFQRTMLRQDMMSQSRTVMQTVTQLLKRGKAGSSIISTPVGSGVPYSQIDFDFQNPGTGSRQCRIWLDNKQVFIQERTPDKSPRAIASNVTGLIFSVDYRDAALVGVTLQMERATDSNPNKEGRVSSILLPNQSVRMIEAP